MTKDEALKLALEALEKSHICPLLPDDCSEAITTIKEALAQPEHGWTPERIAGMARLKDVQDKKLAQPEQEPVTWRYKIVDVFGRPAWTLKTPKSDTRVLESQPLYTASPQRKPLTDEEIWDEVKAADLDWQTGWSLDEDASNRYITFVRAIEAKLKEKNT